MPKHQCGAILSSSDLNLGYPIRDTELTNQLRHSCQNRVHGRVNDRAMGQRCDKAFVALSKSDQNPALFGHQSCAKTSSTTIGPGFSLKFDDVLWNLDPCGTECLDDRGFFERELFGILQMLESATAANAECSATGFNPRSRRIQDRFSDSEGVGPFPPDWLDYDLFARQGAFNEPDFVINPGDASAIMA